jgi:hypothetical protein
VELLHALHMTGTAQVRWSTPGSAGDDGGVGKVAFSVGAVVALDNPAHN